MNQHSLGSLQSVHLGQVVDNADPSGRGQIKVLLLATEMEIWASVIVPSAGQGYGMAFIPKIEEVVVLAFVTPELPLVLGSIWSGQNSMPEEADTTEDHYVIRTPAGTVMEFDDADGPKLSVETPAGHSLTISDSNGGEIEMKRGDQTITLSSSEINISGSKIVLDAKSIEINSPQIKANAAMSQFSGVVQSDTDISNAVVGTSYTPGAGNIW
jgi:uncharacterized protein involved in type VI secretion and phage assembly